MDAKARVLEMAQEAGFDLVGLAPLKPPTHSHALERWLDGGQHGSMDYLERNRERILDPKTSYPEAATLLMVGLGHSRPTLATEGRIARYALGRDYHNKMGKALVKLGKRLAAEGLVSHARAKVDAVPLMERSHAADAGLGVVSKAANLLHPRFGPWFFLGELLLDVDLEPTTQTPNLSCGTCTACIDACPTDAFVGPGTLDARRCISYQTIENRSTIPHDLRKAQGDWLFGCDVCSEVCPWGHKAPDLADRFGVHESVQTLSLIQCLDPKQSQAEFSARYQGSPLSRPKREGLARNAALVLGNVPTDSGRIALLQALENDGSSIVREMSAWALAHGYGKDRGTSLHLDQAMAREPDRTAKAHMERSRDESPE